MRQTPNQMLSKAPPRPAWLLELKDRGNHMCNELLFPISFFFLGFFLFLARSPSDVESLSNLFAKIRVRFGKIGKKYMVTVPGLKNWLYAPTRVETLADWSYTFRRRGLVSLQPRHMGNCAGTS